MPAADAELLSRARAGDESAFAALVDRHHGALTRVAATFVGRSSAEDVAQDTWLAVLRGLDRFEGRSSFRTWLFAILANRARTSAVRDVKREPAVDPARFNEAGAWTEPPVPWTDEVDSRIDAASLAPLVLAAIEQLPPAQREVITLRDIEGLGASDAATVLGVSEGNQRVLLHRARANVRAAVETEVAR